MSVFARWIEHALGVAVKRPHDTDPRKHGRHARRAHFKGKGPARFRDEALKRRCKWFAITPSSGQRFEALGLNCQPITANRPAGAPTSAGFSHDCASARIVPIVLQPRLCFQKSGLVTSFGPWRVILDQRSEPPELDFFVRQSGETRMKKTIASVVLSLALMSSTAMAEERVGDAALGALSGAVVLGPIGAVAGAVIGYTAGPSISSSWGLNRSSAPRQARRAASRDARVPAGASQPVPNQSAPKDQAAPQAAAPARPSATTTASTAPPVQVLE